MHSAHREVQPRAARALTPAGPYKGSISLIPIESLIALKRARPCLRHFKRKTASPRANYISVGLAEDKLMRSGRALLGESVDASKYLEQFFEAAGKLKHRARLEN